MLHPNNPNHRYAPNAPAKEGFTIIEMIMVMGILMVFAIMGGQTYYRQKDLFLYNDALSKTLELIKTPRTYALSSYPVNGTVPSTVMACWSN